MSFSVLDRTSNYGDFRPEEEAETAKQVSKYISEHTGAILPAFNDAVQDPDRQARAAEFSRAQVGDPRLYLPEAADLLYYARFQREAAAFGLNIPLYSTIDPFRINAKGPATLPPFQRPEVHHRWWFLGHEIGFPIGVPASALTGSSEWIAFLANSGYNVLTFKTVRSRAAESYDSPNWAFLPDIATPFAPSTVLAGTPQVRGDATASLALHPAGVSTANSFGVPSSTPEIWQEQVAASLGRIDESQLLIVSVMGDHYGSRKKQHLIDDFVAVAKLACETGARAIELNVSCPNTLESEHGGMQRPLCEDIDLTTEIALAVKAAIPEDTAIVLKLSYAPTSHLRQLVTRVAGSVDGFSAINTLQSRVVDESGRPTFGAKESKYDRTLAGVSGLAIRDLAIEAVTSLATIRAELGLDFDILGMGGVTDPRSFLSLYESGATVVQSASGVFVNGLLARNCIAELGVDLIDRKAVEPIVVRRAIEATVLKYLNTLGNVGTTCVEAGSRLALPINQIYAALKSLELSGRILPTTTNRGGYPVLIANTGSH